ncbi:histidine kinase [Geomonas sp. Red875]|uniref:Histidine kinase n=1 Tax=Geomesophilobacter sediminis TaxID=2798584 RepID=A0A8J7M167_9BACT|nr:histidine kinase [Geomesophilobacter sediminis]
MKKQILAVAAVGALSAATAVPAMALENEFHGNFRVRGILSNFDDGGAGAVNLNGTNISQATGAVVKTGEPNTNTYIEQRLRLMYIAKANDNLKLVTHFEFDSRFGDNSYNSNNSFRNNGGGVGADQTNLETKNIYLDFNLPSTPMNFKVGVQGFTDAYKGIIFNNDAAGVVATAKLQNATINASFFRFDDAITVPANLTGAASGYLDAAAVGTNTQVGNLTRDFYNIGGKYNVSKDLSVGADYYALYSDVLKNLATPRTLINYVGANAAGNVGPASWSGFFLYQFGELGGNFVNSAANPDAASLAARQIKRQSVSAFAANLAGKCQAGPGTARITALYISGSQGTGGDKRTDFQTIDERGATTAGHTFFESNSMLFFRHPQATAGTDRALVFDLNNSGKGIITAFAGYDLPLGKAFVNTNVGIGAVAKDNKNQINGMSKSGDSNILGYEGNVEVGYKVFDNLTTSLQGAYLVLGDFYKDAAANGKTPDNPYTARVVVNYVF